MTASNDTLMARRPRAVSTHEESGWRDRRTASWSEARFALSTMRLIAGSRGKLEETS